MEIKRQSSFKAPEKDLIWFENWAKEIEKSNGRTYQRISLQTSLGKTHVWGLNTADESLEALVIFPGARTSALFWDLDNGLQNLHHALRIYLVETNGLPNSSDGNTPDIKSLGYGEWATEVLDALQLETAFIAGASFGGLVCMKLGIVSPERVKAAFLLNPGCFQFFSFSPKNLYYNLLPIISTSEKNVRKFLDKAVFCKPVHQPSPQAEKAVIDYELFAISRYRDKTQKPYDMGKQLAQVEVDTYLLKADKDLLFPYKKDIQNARKWIKKLKDVVIFEHVGHGIETYAPALAYIGQKIKEYQQS